MDITGKKEMSWLLKVWFDIGLTKVDDKSSWSMLFDKEKRNVKINQVNPSISSEAAKKLFDDGFRLLNALVMI